MPLPLDYIRGHNHKCTQVSLLSPPGRHLNFQSVHIKIHKNFGKLWPTNLDIISAGPLSLLPSRRRWTLLLLLPANRTLNYTPLYVYIGAIGMNSLWRSILFYAPSFSFKFIVHSTDEVCQWWWKRSDGLFVKKTNSVLFPVLNYILVCNIKLKR